MPTIPAPVRDKSAASQQTSESSAINRRRFMRLAGVAATAAGVGTLLDEHPAAAATRVFATVSTDLRGAQGVAGDQGSVMVAGYHRPGDGGGGLFYWDATATDDDNGGTVIAPSGGSGRWRRLYDGLPSARWWGAVGDGVTDDTAAIQTALDAGGTVLIPPGTYRISSALLPRSNTDIVGAGAVLIELAPGASHRAFDLDGVSNVTIRDLVIGAAGGGAVTGAAYGIDIRGNAADILIERVQTRALVRGVSVAGGDGSTPGTCARVTLRTVSANNSPSQFGINVDYANDVTLDDCRASGNWLDGLKIRAHTKNVTVLGGAFTQNGQAWVNGGGTTGDGADCFAGGDTLTIVGTTFDSNYGNGLTIKTDDLTRDDPGAFGYVRNVQVIGVRCRGNNPGYGATFYSFNSDNRGGVPLAAQAAFIGGYFEDNTLDGLWINGRNVSVSAPIARKNRRYGINIDNLALNVSLIAPVVVANSQAGAGTYDGVRIAGAHVLLSGGQIVGVDGDAVTAEAEYGTLTKFHRNNVRVEASASDVTIRDVFESNAVSTGILTLPTAGRVHVHRSGSGSPLSAGSGGGVGSLYTRTDAGGFATLYLKTSGNPSQATTGWQALQPKKLASQAVATTQTTIAHGLGYAPTDVMITPRGNAVVWQSAAADATNVYLTAGAGTSVDVYVR